jgi:hypothetical protein
MAGNKSYIHSFCKIQNNEIILNDKVIFNSESNSFSEFSKAAYKNFEINYPKFFKMDNLSKLAFLGADLLLNTEIDSLQENNIALVFANKSSSLDTDVKYQDTISDQNNYFPSPAVFVYTLPNICLGEISIRHQLKSENSFFIFDDFNAEFIFAYTTILLDTNKAEKVLCGWVEYYKEEYIAFLYLVTKEGEMEHQMETIKTVYKK